jgi:Secretion system C-terminal sorting domain
MKSTMVLCLLVLFALTSYAGIGPKKYVPYVAPKVAAAVDTIFIPGGTFSGGENAGSLEATINADTASDGTRNNPNRVYALNQGQVYYQYASIYYYSPHGTLTICAVPSGSGATKPIIIISPVAPATLEGTNTVYGSLKCEGIHYQTMMTNTHQNSELFYCGTIQGVPQELRVNNCFFEFAGTDIFDCTDEANAIGGWPYGAKFFITNSYFRNMFDTGQWWWSRVFQCKHPIDTLWIENVTTTGGGLTFLQQNELTDFCYIGHNTIVNNHKYWLLSPYRHNENIVSNIFINQNWVGEDTNVTHSGQDPDKIFMSTINIDTCNGTNGLVVQGKYYNGDSSHYTSALDLDSLHIYVADNVNYNDPLIASGYYQSATYQLAGLGTIPSYLGWFGWTPPFVVGNTPGEWMNSRTKALFDDHGPGNGGAFLEKRTDTSDPGTVTSGIADASVVDAMAVWNQNAWGDSRFPTTGNILSSKYIFGDYDPTTLPGIINGVKSDNVTADGAGIQVGITKFTDLTENFSHPGKLSLIDGLPIGSLIWNDQQLALDPAATMAKVYTQWLLDGGRTGVSTPSTNPLRYNLSQNYPNPFNPSTRIEFTLAKESSVDLKVFNILGQEVATLVHGNLTSGSHAVTFDAKNLASGIYIYRITAGDYTSAKRMMLLK